MQTIHIKAHYLEAYNPVVKKKPTIELLVDWETRDKIRNVVNSLTGFRSDDPTAPKPRSPLHKQGDDNLLTVNVPNMSVMELIGNEIEVEIKLTKYQLVSKYEVNKGQKIIGVTAKLVTAKISQ